MKNKIFKSIYLRIFLIFILIIEVVISGSIIGTQQAKAAGENWYSSSWQYRKAITISGSSTGAQTNYQVKLNVPYTAGMKSDFGDIRFTAANGSDILTYWQESFTVSGSSVFWIKLPNIPASPATSTIYMYYGNQNATTTSNGNNTFNFFDDFSNPNIGNGLVLSPSQSWETNGKLRWGTIANVNGTYYIYYTNGASSNSSIGRASSTDLMNWTKNSNNPLIANSIGPSILKELDGQTPVYVNGKYWMLTIKADGSTIELRSAPSITSNTWTLENGSLITPTAQTWYSAKVFSSSFTKEGNTYYIFMEAMDSTGKWQVGYLTSTSPSGPYTNKGVVLSPSLSWEGTGILDPEMRKFGNTYYLFYTGNVTNETYQNSYATSSGIGGPYTKSDIKITPIKHTYPAILKKDSYYYIITDNQTNTGKNIFKRADLNGMFPSAFKWGMGGNGSYNVSNGILSLTGPKYSYASTNFGVGTAIRFRGKMDYTTTYKWMGLEEGSMAGASADVNLDIFKTAAAGGNTVITESNNTNSKDTNLGAQYTNYKIWEIARTGSQTKFSINDSLKNNGNTYPSTTERHPVFHAYTSSSSLSVDWIAARKYVSPEPSSAITGSEETNNTSTTPTPTSTPTPTPIATPTPTPTSTPTPTPTPNPSNPIAFWRFDEGSGTTTSDSSGNSYHGSITGATWTTNGKINKALNYSGNGYVVANATTMPSNTPFTVTAWINPNTASSWRDIVSKYGSWSVQINKQNRLNFEITGKKDVTSSMSIPANTWTHIAVSYSAGTVKFYKNGSWTQTITQSYTPNTNSNSTYIGGLQNLGAYYYGIIDEVKVFDKALNNSEILTEYQRIN